MQSMKYTFRTCGKRNKAGLFCCYSSLMWGSHKWYRPQSVMLECLYVVCVFDTVNVRSFVWKFLCGSFSFIHSPSLTLSLSHTLTHISTYTKHFCRPLSLSPSVSLSLSHTHTHTPTFSFSWPYQRYSFWLALASVKVAGVKGHT